MVKVSVIVPVFDPGERIDRLIASLLGQSLPAAEYEVVFVDDGSTDGTGERLEALAAEHAHVTTVRIPNSGWPGRPRNVGLDTAKGEFVYFVDHDDYLGDEALERLYATAITDEADIVIGKVVGHNRSVPRSLFRVNVHRLGLKAAPFNLLTPHKLFRRALLEEHGIRFPEGKRRLEDHMFVVPAYFAARNMAILADYACYHWVNWVHRDSRTNASFVAPDPAEYFADVAGVLDVVDAHTQPGEFRDTLYGRWYRGKLLARIGRNAFVGRPEEHRRGVLAAVRTLMEERFPARLDDGLPPNLRLRSALARRDDYDGLVALAELERDLKVAARVREFRGDGTWMTLRLECWLRFPDKSPLQVVRRDGRVLLHLPEALAARLEPGELDVTDQLADGRVQLLLKPAGEETDWIVPTEAEVVVPEAPDGEPVQPSLWATARIAPTIAAGGLPLAPGDHDLRAVVWIAGFTAHAPARRGSDTFGLTVTAAGRVYRQGSVPVPPVLTPKQKLRRSAGRFVRRTRGPRAAAAGR